MSITIAGPREIRRFAGRSVVSTVSNSGGWMKGLSPFVLGPVPLYDGTFSKNFENAWQYAKVYRDQLDANGEPAPGYFAWARQGWDNPRAVRYPRGKGAVPAYAWWNGVKLGYVEARKTIYFPLYRDAVRMTAAWRHLHEMHARGDDLILFDYDGYDHDALGMSLREVLNCPTRKMGHAFVLKAMLLYGADVRPEDLAYTHVPWGRT